MKLIELLLTQHSLILCESVPLFLVELVVTDLTFGNLQPIFENIDLLVFVLANIFLKYLIGRSVAPFKKQDELNVADFTRPVDTVKDLVS